VVDFKPLQGLEFDTAVAGDFGSLISPPYDVVNATLRQKLVAANQYNIVRITLPEAQGDLDRYAAAAKLAQDWQARGVLKQGPLAFYVVEQRFASHHIEYTRTAIGGHLRLAPWREGGVYPHEVTLPRPKADRLSLYRSTRMQHGPVFSLFEDAGGAISRIVGRVKSGQVYREAEGPEGSYDRVWRVTDAGTLDELQKLFAKEKFFIADGHHRYETALAYRNEVASGKALPADHPANFVLMFAVPFDDPGVVILPTHRLLCLDGDATAMGLGALSADYEIRDATLEDLGDVCSTPCETIGLYYCGGMHLLRMKEASREGFRGAVGELMADLNVFEVKEKVLPAFFSNVSAAIDQERIKYTHDLAEATSRIDAGECAVALVLAPITVRQMAKIASAGRTMPPKSTYFYPKLPTGVVMKALV